MPTPPARVTPFTLDLLDHFGLDAEQVVRISPDTVEGDVLTMKATLWMPTHQYEALVEKHRPKTALEELDEVRRLGDLRPDQITPREREWLAQHPLGPTSLHGKKPRAVADLVALWLRQREGGES